MKITGLETRIFSSQHRNAKRNWLIVLLHTDEGIEGIGEASMLGYDPVVANLLEHWGEMYLVGKDLMASELHWMRLYQDNIGRGVGGYSPPRSQASIWPFGTCAARHWEFQFISF